MVTTFIALFAVYVVKQFSTVQTVNESNVVVSRENQPILPTFEVLRLLPTPTKYPTFDIPTRTATVDVTVTEIVSTEIPSLLLPQSTSISLSDESPGASRQNPASAGTPFRGNQWEIHVIDVISGEAAYTVLSNIDGTLVPPPAMNEYVLVRFKAFNRTSSGGAISFTNSTFVALTGSSSRVYFPTSVRVPTPFEGDVLPGGWIEGEYAYFVPVNEKERMFAFAEMNGMTSMFFVRHDPFARIDKKVLKVLTDTTEGASFDWPASKSDLIVQNPIAFKVVEFATGEDAAEMVKNADGTNPIPPEGKKYICIRIQLKYYGEDSFDSLYGTYDALKEFRVLGSNRVVYPAIQITEPEPAFSVNNFAFPGGIIDGWIVRLVPKDQHAFVLQYESQFGRTIGVTRYVQLPNWTERKP